MHDKLELSKEWFKVTTFKGMSLPTFMNIIWKTKEPDNFQLTKSGLVELRNINVKFTTYKLHPFEMYGNLVLDLKNTIRSPFYLDMGRKTLYVFDNEELGIELTLYDFDLVAYLKANKLEKER